MSKRLKDYLVRVPASVKVYRLFTVQAKSEEDAIERHKADQSEFQEEEFVETLSEGDPTAEENS